MVVHLNNPCSKEVLYVYTYKVQRILTKSIYTLTYSKSTFRIYLKKRSTVLTDKRRETEPLHTQCQRVQLQSADQAETERYFIILFWFKRGNGTCTYTWLVSVLIEGTLLHIAQILDKPPPHFRTFKNAVMCLNSIAVYRYVLDYLFTHIKIMFLAQILDINNLYFSFPRR